MNLFGWHSSRRGFRRVPAPAGVASPPSEPSETLRHSDSSCGMERGLAALVSLAKVTCRFAWERGWSPLTGAFRQDRSGSGELHLLLHLEKERSWLVSEMVVEADEAPPREVCPQTWGKALHLGVLVTDGAGEDLAELTKLASLLTKRC